MVDSDIPTDQAVWERARRVIPGGVNSGQRLLEGIADLVVAATHGASFTDAAGRTYTDYHAAFGPPLLGHNDPDVDSSVQTTLRSVDLMGVGITRVEVELAERLTALIPSIEKVLLTVTGSEATFHALRVARAATGRRYIVKFQGCYHGWHDSVAMNVISLPERIGTKDPLSQGILREVLDATIVAPFNDVPAFERIMGEYGDDVAAVIVEPIPHNIGAVLPKPGFLEKLRELCSKYGAVLIFDEVVTGFRHSLGGYQSIAGVTPDLTTLGKAMGNGYPIAALGGRSDLMDLFSTVSGRPAFFAGTYNGHPAMAAAALATIDKLLAQPVHEHLFALGERIRGGLVDVYREIGIETVVSGYGSVFVTYFMRPPADSYTDLLRNDAELFVRYRRRLMDWGIFELPLNLKRSHVSFAHRNEDVDRLLECTDQAVRSLLATSVNE